MDEDLKFEKVEVLKRIGTEWVPWDHNAEHLPSEITNFLSVLFPREEKLTKAEKVRDGG